MGFSERLQFIIDATGTGAIKTFKDVGNAADTHLSVGTKAGGKLAGSLDDLAARSPLVGKAFAKLGTDGTQLASTIGTALPGAALAGAAGIGALAVTSVAKFQDLAGSVLDFQRVVGASAEQSSAFVAVLDDYAISAEAGGKAIFKMADIAGSTPEKFAKFGVEIAKNKDGTTDLQGTLLNVAEAYETTGDDATRAALLMDLFGRRGAELIPILEKGKDGADGLAAAFAGVEGQQILSQGQLDQAEDTRLALDRLNDAVGEFTLALGSGLSPMVAQVANQLSTFSETADAVLGPLGGLDTAIGFMTDSLISGGPVLKLAKDGIGELAGGADEATIGIGILSETVDALNASNGPLAGSTTAVTQALALGLTPAAVINETALLNDAAAADELKAAQSEAKQKSDELAASFAAQRSAADALFNATVGLANADLAYRNSVDATEDAVNAMREAHWAAAAAGYGDAAANEALDDATRGAEGAMLAEAEAAVRAAEETAALSGATLSAKEKADIMKGALEGLKNKFPELSGVIDDYKNKLNNIPSNVTTTVMTNYVSQGSKPAHGVGKLDTGGPVPGPKGQPWGGVVHGGEFVLSADVVDAIKHGDQTRGLGVGTGGGVQGSGTTNYNLVVNAGLGANGNQIGNEIVNILKNWEKSNGPGWRQ